ncbi:MAG: adenine phosphoribosyltransferase [Alphaproteobacteria bacterium]|nr:adenine phosphoribosyltransferase [Alphaproteobacteria bacterium]
MSIEDIKNSIRNVPDFPKKGIQFKDITTAIKNPKIYREIIDLMAQEFGKKKIDYVIGIEARGFILAAALAYKLGCGFVPVRKANKLPAQVLTQKYALEYGTDSLEIHADSLEKGANVLIVDDLLATGGTALATAKLVKQLEANIAAFAFIIELKDLNGAATLEPYGKVFSLITW